MATYTITIPAGTNIYSFAINPYRNPTLQLGTNEYITNISRPAISSCTVQWITGGSYSDVRFIPEIRWGSDYTTQFISTSLISFSGTMSSSNQTLTKTNIAAYTASVTSTISQDTKGRVLYVGVYDNYTTEPEPRYKILTDIVLTITTETDSSSIVHSGRYNGSSYDPVVPYYYNGSAWVPCEWKRYNGSSWDNVDTM